MKQRIYSRTSCELRVAGYGLQVAHTSNLHGLKALYSMVPLGSGLGRTRKVSELEIDSELQPIGRKESSSMRAE